MGFAADRRALLSSGLALAPTAGYRSRALAPSIFGAIDSARAVWHRNPASVHPASPVLLTKNGPLGALDPWHGSTEQPHRPTYLKFENRSRALRPDASNHWLYPIELALGSSYPEGNFGDGTTTNGSISLSPLYPSQRPICTYALTRTLHKDQGRSDGATHIGFPPISFLAPYGFTRPLNAPHVRLLGPCFKTGRMGSPQADARSAQVPKHAESARARPQS
ncbi:hypothetical protein KIW84_UN0552 [Lathyrus oleraceus]|nr:hypothetical protein KIW84_UN0552 [Pisum sativum]